MPNGAQLRLNNCWSALDSSALSLVIIEFKAVDFKDSFPGSSILWNGLNVIVSCNMARLCISIAQKPTLCQDYFKQDSKHLSLKRSSSYSVSIELHWALLIFFANLPPP